MSVWLLSDELVDKNIHPRVIVLSQFYRLNQNLSQFYTKPIHGRMEPHLHELENLRLLYFVDHRFNMPLNAIKCVYAWLFRGGKFSTTLHRYINADDNYSLAQVQ
jgi:hypothetical protein